MMRRKCKLQPLTKTILKESIELKPGYRPPSPETLKNRDVFEEPTGTVFTACLGSKTLLSANPQRILEYLCQPVGYADSLAESSGVTHGGATELQN